MAGVSLFAGVFLTALAAKERDNRFCVSCHLRGKPLHEAKFSRLVSGAPTDLAGVHHTKKAEVGCIACHGGADPVMRARVWTVAAFDTVKYLAGRFDEPTHMRLPLRDTECRQCHTPILKPAPAPPASAAPTDPADPAVAAFAMDPAAMGASFHGIRDHAAVDVRCVRCHTAHTTDSDAANRFVARERLAPVCRECHPQMQ